MPVYEFFCPTCKSSFELLRSMRDYDHDADCPNCAAPARKTLSVFAAITNTRSSSVMEMLPMCGAEGFGGGGGCACGGACMHGA